MVIFKRLLALAKPHLPKFLLAILCMLVVGTSTSALAFLVKPALDEIFLKKNAALAIQASAEEGFAVTALSNQKTGSSGKSSLRCSASRPSAS